MLEILSKRRRLGTIATILVVVGVLVLFIAPVTFAQDEESQPEEDAVGVDLAIEDLEQIGTDIGLEGTNIRVLIARIIRIAIMLVGIIFFAIVVYGGILWMTSRGDAEQLKKAQSVLKNGVIGLLIILSSYAIASFILNALLRGSGVYDSESEAPPAGVEPLSGSLGTGIIEDHWPQRNAVDVARNTNIIITFKEPIDVDSLTLGDPIEDEDGDPATVSDNVWYLNNENVLIYKNTEGEDLALESAGVEVMTNFDQTIWIFNPVEYLGSALQETNYTVSLQSTILKEDGDNAFVGNYDDGYEWSFEVSTEIDITPPYVTSVIPGHATERDRNIVVQVNFNEAVDPTSASGVFNLGFENILVVYSTVDEQILDEFVDGTWTISNGYRTVEFVASDACGEDPCGDTIYCLPASSYIETTVYAATLGEEPPEAAGFPYDGVVDVCGNSLDSGISNHNPEGEDKNGVAEGPDIDNYFWRFGTTEEVNVTSPSINSITPDEGAEEVDLDAAIEFIFTGTDDTGPGGESGVTVMSSTLTNSIISFTPYQAPDSTHELWYRIEKQDLYAGYVDEPSEDDEEPTATKAIIDHGLLVESEDLSNPWYYYPWIPEDVKSSYQICFYPAYGPPLPDYCDVDDDDPSCCYLEKAPTCPFP